MNSTFLHVFFYFLIILDITFCSRQHRIKKKIANTRLSRYISKGRLRFSIPTPETITDDEDLLYEAGSGVDRDVQGDGVPAVEDELIQKSQCCTLGNGSSTRRGSCSAKPYIRVIKRNIRHKLVSEKLGLDPVPLESDYIAQAYKCVLKFHGIFEKCCQASQRNILSQQTHRRHRQP